VAVGIALFVDLNFTSQIEELIISNLNSQIITINNNKDLASEISLVLIWEAGYLTYQ
jgi:hypothetical protein